MRGRLGSGHGVVRRVDDRALDGGLTGEREQSRGELELVEVAGIVRGGREGGARRKLLGDGDRLRGDRLVVGGVDVDLHLGGAVGGDGLEDGARCAAQTPTRRLVGLRAHDGLGQDRRGDIRHDGLGERGLVGQLGGGGLGERGFGRDHVGSGGRGRLGSPAPVLRAGQHTRPVRRRRRFGSSACAP